MFVLGNSFGEETNEVTGVLLRQRKEGTTASLWLRVDDKAVRRAIANVIYRDMGMPPDDRIKWMPHSVAIEGGPKKVTPISRL